MSIESLCKVMAPPTVPLDSGNSEDFTKIEDVIGIELPNDYKKYINLFGTGCIGSFLWPFNPFSNEENLNFTEQVKIRLDALKEIKDKYGDAECPYSLYPEPQGLLPWGTDENGNVLYWLTAGHPNDWNVVINEARGPKYEQFKDSMTSFLEKLISGKIISQIIPYDFLDRNGFR